MISTINLGQKIRVDKTKTMQQIGKIARKHDPNCLGDLFGLWHAHRNTIYIAKDISHETQKQVLIHEIAEAINYLAELNLHNKHDKIILIEQFITMLLTGNTRLISLLNRKVKNPNAASD